MSEGKQTNVSKRAIKAGTWYTLSNFLLKGMGFITTPIFTRLLTKQDFGDYSNFTAWLSILAILATVELRSSVVRARYDYEDHFDEFLSSITVCGTAITAVFYVVVLLFQGFFSDLLGMDMVYVHIMFLNVLISPALSILQAKHQILQRYKSFVLVSLGSTLTSTFLSVFCVIHFENKLFGRIIGSTIPLLVVYLIAYILLLSRGRCLFNTEYWKYAILYSAPLVPHLLANTLLGSSDRIMIKKMCGAEQTAVYSLAYTCGMIVATLFTSMNQAWEPWLFDRLHEKDYHTIRKVSRIYLLFFVCLVEGAILIAPELMALMGGKGYQEAVYVVPPVMIGYGCKFTYTFYVNVEKYEKKTAFISIGTLLAAGINIVLNYIFIPIFGYQAAAYTTLIGFLLLVILHYLMSRKMNITQMYDNKFVFGMVLFMIVTGIAAQLLYLNTWVRYGVIAMTGSIVLFLAYRLYKKLFERKK